MLPAVTRPSTGLDDAFAELGAADDLVARQVLAGVRKALFDRDDDPVRIDRFVIANRIGSGAMGIVYAAYDPKLDRKVALKVLAATDQNARRDALREARALARLNDPNVVVIHDAGELEGHAWVAMEFIAGITLDRASLAAGWKEIVQLFAAAAHGLAAAHEAGIVHRDFKPTNVIVGNDVRGTNLHGRVRVLDFGLAHLGPATAPEAMVTHGDDSRHDGSSARVGQPGTVSYMAPEQLEGKDPDARADQFAFCVALFEALFGHRPFIAAHRSELLAQMRAGVLSIPLRPRVPAWLGRVLTRGLALDPDDRYRDMRALLRDLESNRGRGTRSAVLGLGSAAVAATIAFAAASSTRDPCATAAADVDAAWNDEARERMQAGFRAVDVPYAEHAWIGTRDGLGAYAEGLVAMRAAACQATMQRGALDVPHPRRDQCLDARTRAFTHAVRILSEPDATVVERASEVVDGLPDLQLCAHESVLASALPVPDSEEDHLRIEASRDDLAGANALRAAGNYANADALATGALATANEIGYAPLIAEAEDSLALLRDIQGETAEAERLWRDALFVAETNDHVEVAALASTSLVVLLAQDRSRTERAEEMAARCWAVLVRAGEPTDLVADYLQAQRMIHMNAGNYADALAWSERAIQLADNPILEATALSGRGALLDRLGRPEEAVHDMQRALELVRNTLGPDHPIAGDYMFNLGKVLSSTGEFERARVLFDDTRVNVERNLGAYHAFVADIEQQLSFVYEGAGDLARAIESARAAIRILSANDEATPYVVARKRETLAWLLLKNGDTEQALAEFEALHRLFDQHGTADALSAIYALHGKGETLLAMNRPGDALAPLEEARSRAAERRESPLFRAGIDISLGKSLVAAGRDRARALALVRDAIATLAASPNNLADDLAEARAWLRKHAP